MINKERLIKLVRKLISINSQNPPGDESSMARFVVKYLKGFGLNSRIYEFKKKRSNVIAILEGIDKKRALLITPHLDTVPAGKNWSYPPFSGRISKGKIYGLGSTDCKGNLACALEALNCIAEERLRLPHNLVLAATADEESGSELGLIPLLDKKILKVDSALVLDSDDFDIIVAQKGLLHLKVSIQGKRAHGAYPWRGINAIDIALEVLREIKESRFIYKKNKYLRPPTLNIGTIKGGDKVNIVADWCEFELDFRFLPGSSSGVFIKRLRGILKKHASKFKIEIEGLQAPYLIERTHPLVVSLKKAMLRNNARPVIKGSEGATVITFFQEKGIPALATGFGSGGCAHTQDEYVKIGNLCKGTSVLVDFLKTYKF